MPIPKSSLFSFPAFRWKVTLSHHHPTFFEPRSTPKVTHAEPNTELSLDSDLNSIIIKRIRPSRRTLNLLISQLVTQYLQLLVSNFNYKNKSIGAGEALGVQGLDRIDRSKLQVQVQVQIQKPCIPYPSLSFVVSTRQLSRSTSASLSTGDTSFFSYTSPSLSLSLFTLC